MNSMIRELPPWLTNGRGMPVTGSSLMFTAMLMNTWNRIMMVIPVASSRPN